MTNPYSPPSASLELATDPRAAMKARLSRPATALIIMASIHSVFTSLNLISALMMLSIWDLDSYDILEISMLTLQFIVLLLIAIGGAKMGFLESLTMARLGAVLACVPFLSPFGLLGIPFGIWSLVLLADPEIKAAFPSSKSTV